MKRKKRRGFVFGINKKQRAARALLPPVEDPIWHGPPVITLAEMSPAKRAEMVRLYGPLSRIAAKTCARADKTKVAA